MKMKIAIIGAGNMGASIAGGLSNSRLFKEAEIWVSNPSPGRLERLKRQYAGLSVTHDNTLAAKDADAVILAVKPWILPEVISQLKPVLDYTRQAIVSIAGGVTLADLDKMLGADDGVRPDTFYVIPNTAISVGKGMTFVCASDGASDAHIALVHDCFAAMGSVAVIDGRHMDAGLALCSCGIAYVYKYIQGCVQAGVQLGFRPAEALDYTIQTVEGAAEMLRHNHTTPQEEIDRVTTPGGMTIRGINSLDHTGFVSSIITANLESLKK